MSNESISSSKRSIKVVSSLIMAWAIFTIFFISIQYIWLYITEADISSTFKILLLTALSLLMITQVVVLIFILRKINGDRDYTTFFISQGVLMSIMIVVSLVFNICYFLNFTDRVPAWLSISGVIVILILVPGIVIYFLLCFLIGFSRGDSSLVVLIISIILNGVIWYFYGYSIYYLITKLHLKRGRLQSRTFIDSQTKVQKIK